MGYYGDWREWFREQGENTEDAYQAFKDRFQAEANGEELRGTPEELAEQQRIEEEDEHYLKYEKKNEYYREQWAIKEGYKFKSKAYDPKEKYR